MPFMLFMLFLLSLSCIIHCGYYSSQCSFPSHVHMPILFLFTQTVAHSSHQQLHTFTSLPHPYPPDPQTTPVLFSLSLYHHTRHTKQFFLFHTHTFCNTSSRLPTTPSLLNQTYYTHSTGIQIPVKDTKVSCLG